MRRKRFGIAVETGFSVIGGHSRCRVFLPPRPRVWAAAAYPGAVVQTATAAADWSNLENLLADDALNATTAQISPGGNSERVTCSNFDFSGLPDGATVTGVVVTLDISANGNQCSFSQLTLWDATAGAAIGNDRSGQMPGIAVGSPVEMNVGEPDSLGGWGAAVEGLSLADFKSATFGLRFRVRNDHQMVTRIVACDFVRMTLFYK